MNECIPTLQMAKWSLKIRGLSTRAPAAEWQSRKSNPRAPEVVLLPTGLPHSPHLMATSWGFGGGVCAPRAPQLLAQGLAQNRGWQICRESMSDRATEKRRGSWGRRCLARILWGLWIREPLQPNSCPAIWNALAGSGGWGGGCCLRGDQCE